MPALRHRPLRQLIIGAVTLLGAISNPIVAQADPPIAPPAPPIIGPLQYGPPGYPAAIGIPLIPAARSGVSTSADTLSPTPRGRTQAPSGISGVQIAADVLNPTPTNLP